MCRTYGLSASDLRGDNIVRTVEEQRLIDNVRKYNFNKDKIVSLFGVYFISLKSISKSLNLSSREVLIDGYENSFKNVSNHEIFDSVSYIKYFNFVYNLFVTLECDFPFVNSEFVSYVELSEFLNREKFNVIKLYLSSVNINLSASELSRLSKDGNLSIFINLISK